MIILEDSRGIVLKRTIQDKNHVRLSSSGRIYFSRVNCWLTHRKAEKPYVDMTFNELSDLMDELDGGIVPSK